MAKGNKSVSTEEVEALLARAAKAGAKEGDVAGMREAIAANAVAYEEILAAVEGAEGAQTFVVAGPGAINLNGKIYKAGETVQLTASERESLGEAVTVKVEEAKAIPLAERTAGRYRVTGGAVNHDGVLYEQGQTLHLSDEWARLIPNVEPA